MSFSEPQAALCELTTFSHPVTHRGASRIRLAVDRLKRLARDASLEFALEVGRVVVETIHDGDLGAWRSRGRKEHALRSLCADPELPISASALYRALAIYELSCRPDADVSSWKHLGVSHVRAVLGLTPDSQLKLLGRAEAQRWTVTKLEGEVRACRACPQRRGGRRPTPRYLRSIRQIYQLTMAEALSGLDDGIGLRPAELEELMEKLSRARQRLAQLEKVLPRRPTAGDRT